MVFCRAIIVYLLTSLALGAHRVMTSAEMTRLLKMSATNSPRLEKVNIYSDKLSNHEHYNVLPHHQRTTRPVQLLRLLDVKDGITREPEVAEQRSSLKRQLLQSKHGSRTPHNSEATSSRRSRVVAWRPFGWTVTPTSQLTPCPNDEMNELTTTTIPTQPEAVHVLSRLECDECQSKQFSKLLGLIAC